MEADPVPSGAVRDESHVSSDHTQVLQPSLSSAQPRHSAKSGQ